MIEVRFKADLHEAAEFVNNKTSRLQELYDNLSQNADSIKGYYSARESSLPMSDMHNILLLKDEQIWKDFEGKTKDGLKIISAIKASTEIDGHKLVPALNSMFAKFAEHKFEFVFSPDLIDALVNKYPTI